MSMTDVDELLDLKDRKKKRKAKPRFQEAESISTADSHVPGDDDYPYEWLLARALKQTSGQSRERAIFPVPKIVREGTRKTVWTNFTFFVSKCHRPSEHVQKFISSELSIQCSQLADGRLCMKGRLGSSQVESQCRKYVNEFVICSNCKGSETLLEHDSQTRLNFISCQLCLARRCAAVISRGFVPRSHRQTEREEDG